MSTDRDVTAIVRSWLEEGRTALPDRVLDAVLDQLPATPQRRALWPARRFNAMNTTARFLSAVAAVAVVAVIGVLAIPRLSGSGGLPPSSSPSPTVAPSTAAPGSVAPSAAAPRPSASALALRDGTLAAGTYIVSPQKDGFWTCPAPATASCTDTISVLLTVPDGWTGGTESVGLRNNAPPDGASLLFTRGAPLYVDPCGVETGTVPVGPKAADFANALANHPRLDVTTPVDVTLAGSSGKYVDLQVPADLSACTVYRPWEPGLYAQGPSQRWHLWILDVGGQRVVVQSTDYAGTPAADRNALQAIVESIEFES